MINNKLKGFLVVFAGVFVALSLVLAVHIYMVTRPKQVDAQTLSMARFDIKNQLGPQDSAKIQAWLYRQVGVSYVLVNPHSQIAVFSYYPAKASADKIAMNFRVSSGYDAVRYVPTKQELEKGCPVLPDEITHRVTAFLNK